MKSKLLVISMVLGLGLVFAGCASAPTEEINATKAALAAVQTDDVRTYAPESLQAAENELNKALAEVQTQDNKFALSRDYKQASALLKSAKDLAEKAKSDAEANKAKTKADANGIAAVRAFYGTHRVRAAGKEMVVTLSKREGAKVADLE